MEMQGNEPRFSVDLLTKPSTSTADVTGSLSSMLQSTSSVDNLSSTSLTENVTTVSSLLDKYKKLLCCYHSKQRFCTYILII